MTKISNYFLPYATLYRPENPKLQPANTALFYADDDTNMTEIYSFANNIKAKRLIAICPYHQYYECLAYADNVIFCHEKDKLHLVAWLESTEIGYINIENDELEFSLNKQKFHYFTYLKMIKKPFTNQINEHIEILRQADLPRIDICSLICDIDCSHNFELDDYMSITTAIETVVDIDSADIFYGINFNLPKDNHALHLLMA